MIPPPATIFKCLYGRTKRLATKPSVISNGKKHPTSVLVSNGYPLSFLQKITKTRKPSTSAESTIEYKSTAVLPYVKSLSKQLRRRRRRLQQQRIRAVFKSETKLTSHLARPKDAVEPPKQDGVVYRIPCECSKVYIGETGRPMQDRIKQHERDMDKDKATTNVYFYSFFPRTLRQWNSLPSDIVESSSLPQFQSKLSDHLNNV